LDSIWLAGGTHRLKQLFSALARRNQPEALRQINDERLRFPVLFILMPEISAEKMYTGLSQRNLAALNICSRKIYKHEIDAAATVAANSDTYYQTLKWMLETGKDWDGPSDGRDPYDAVIDYTAALLTVTYEDKTVLKDIAGLIFRRNRKGLFMHDLVWSFFQVLDRDALVIIAGYLLSNNPRDVDLAAKLLNMNAQASNRGEVLKAHRKYIDWLDDNRPYLYLTGEHFQSTSEPKHMDADTEAKYLGKEISPRYRAPVEPLTENEVKCLHKYREAAPEEQALLTSYSHKLRRRDAKMWYEWMQKQTAEQVIAARSTYEVL
jgi:hypothetical protein